MREDTGGPFGGPDEQLAYLRRAVLPLEQWLEARPDHGEDTHDAQVDHLIACVYAVDAMCVEGHLPADWQSRASGAHLHTWKVLGAQPHTPFAMIGKPTPHTIALIRCSGCGDLETRTLPGTWTLPDLRGFTWEDPQDDLDPAGNPWADDAFANGEEAPA